MMGWKRGQSHRSINLFISSWKHSFCLYIDYVFSLGALKLKSGNRRGSQWPILRHLIRAKLWPVFLAVGPVLSLPPVPVSTPDWGPVPYLTCDRVYGSNLGIRLRYHWGFWLQSHPPYILWRVTGQPAASLGVPHSHYPDLPGKHFWVPDQQRNKKRVRKMRSKYHPIDKSSITQNRCQCMDREEDALPGTGQIWNPIHMPEKE